MTELLVENKVVVKIFGEEYPVTGIEDPAYISKVADFVDSRMKQVAGLSRAKSRDKVAILAALSLASELFEKADSLDSYNHSQHSNLDSLISRLDDALMSDVTKIG